MRFKVGVRAKCLRQSKRLIWTHFESKQLTKHSESFLFISDHVLIHFFVLSVLLHREENVSKLLSNDAERDAGKENQS